MPGTKTVERIRQARREGKRPTPQAGEFIREEIHHLRRGKHDTRSTIWRRPEPRPEPPQPPGPPPPPDPPGPPGPPRPPGPRRSPRRRQTRLVLRGCLTSGLTSKVDRSHHFAGDHEAAAVRRGAFGDGALHGC